MIATINPVYPFDFNRLYGDEKYKLNNMLLKQVGMVKRVAGNDWINSVWSDCVYSEWDAARHLLTSRESGDAYFAGVPDDAFMAFMDRLFTLIEKREIRLTGAAVVRHTNATSGYPVLQIIGVISTQPKTGMPLIGYSRPRRMSRYGYYGLDEMEIEQDGGLL